jgi:hypothetical protein
MFFQFFQRKFPFFFAFNHNLYINLDNLQCSHFISNANEIPKQQHSLVISLCGLVLSEMFGGFFCEIPLNWIEITINKKSLRVISVHFEED